MRANFVIDPLIGKRSQLLLATQLCRMVCVNMDRSVAPPQLIIDMQVLKINNVIVAGSDEYDF